MRPEGIARFFVRFIRESVRRSKKQFKAPAPPADKKPASISTKIEYALSTYSPVASSMVATPTKTFNAAMAGFVMLK
jgi:hypothetical protein